MPVWESRSLPVWVADQIGLLYCQRWVWGCPDPVWRAVGRGEPPQGEAASLTTHYLQYKQYTNITVADQIGLLCCPRWVWGCPDPVWRAVGTDEPPQGEAASLTTRYLQYKQYTNITFADQIGLLCCQRWVWECPDSVWRAVGTDEPPQGEAASLVTHYLQYKQYTNISIHTVQAFN